MVLARTGQGLEGRNLALLGLVLVKHFADGVLHGVAKLPELEALEAHSEDWVGGPMYYIKNGLGKNWKWLGVVFGVFGGLASFGIGNAVQVGNITDSINTAIQSFVPSAADHRMTINVVLAVILMIVVGIVLIGGIKRIGAVTERSDRTGCR